MVKQPAQGHTQPGGKVSAPPLSSVHPAWPPPTATPTHRTSDTAVIEVSSHPHGADVKGTVHPPALAPSAAFTTLATHALPTPSPLLASIAHFPGLLLHLCSSFSASLATYIMLELLKARSLALLSNWTLSPLGSWPQPMAPVTPDTQTTPLPVLSSRQLTRISYGHLPTCPKCQTTSVSPVNPTSLKGTPLHPAVQVRNWRMAHDFSSSTSYSIKHWVL